MWYWIEGILCILAGGAGGYLWGARGKALAENELMLARGYVKRGQDWIKSVVTSL